MSTPSTDIRDDYRDRLTGLTTHGFVPHSSLQGASRLRKHRSWRACQWTPGAMVLGPFSHPLWLVSQRLHSFDVADSFSSLLSGGSCSHGPP